MSLRYLSVCSGIEAATVAWHGLGWTPVAFGEIEAFPSAVLRTHYPHVPNWGDMTRFQEWPHAAVDVLVGGTPCQSFSVAGLRKGLADPRGNLALTYLAIADKYRPRWVVWENVPGVLSSNGGRDFGAFVGGLGELGYGWAYRILDAQYFGVPQRRRRVFVVGCLRGWQRAAAVLFEQHSLSGYSPPRRETWQGVARSTAASLTGSGRGIARSGESRGQDDVVIASTGDVAACLETTSHDYSRADGFTMIAYDILGTPATQAAKRTDIHVPLRARLPGQSEASTTTVIAHALRGEGFDASETGTGRGTLVAPVVFHPTQDPISSTDGTTHAMGCGSRQGQETVGVAQPIGLDEEQNAMVDGFGTLKARMEGGGFEGSVMTMAMQVRRLTPVECERLQGFPDGYTAIPWRGKDAADCPDGPRYKALGNSMAVPVMRWIGERLAAVEAIAADVVVDNRRTVPIESARGQV